jgi:hypothetical protein
MAPTTGRKRIQDRIGKTAVSSSSMMTVGFGYDLHLNHKLNNQG